MNHISLPLIILALPLFITPMEKEKDKEHKRHSADSIIIKRCSELFKTAKTLDNATQSSLNKLEHQTVLDAYVKALKCFVGSFPIVPEKTVEVMEVIMPKILLYAQMLMDQDPHYMLPDEALALYEQAAALKEKQDKTKQRHSFDFSGISLLKHALINEDQKNTVPDYEKVVREKFKRHDKDYDTLIFGELSKEHPDPGVLYLGAGLKELNNAQLLEKLKEDNQLVQQKYYSAFNNFIEAHKSNNKHALEHAEKTMDAILALESKIQQKNAVVREISQQLSSACQALRNIKVEMEKVKNKK